MLRGRDVQDFGELKRQGLSIRVISRLTGYCRKTVRKYLIQPNDAKSPLRDPPAGRAAGSNPWGTCRNTSRHGTTSSGPGCGLVGRF